MAAPLRPTQQTALHIARQLGGDLARWARELGPLTAAPTLAEGVEAVLAASHDPALDIEVLIDDGATSDDLDAIAACIHPSLTGNDSVAAASGRVPLTPGESNTADRCTIRVVAPLAAHARAAGAVRASVVVAASTAPTPTFIDAVALWCDDRPLLVWIGKVPATLRASAWLIEGHDPAVETTVWDRLRLPPLRDLWGVLRTDSSVRALQSLVSVSGAAVEQELRGLRARRSIAQQHATAAQPRPQATGNELLGEVRSSIQRQFTEFLRGVEDRASDTFAPLTGPVWQEIDEQLLGVEDLEREPRLKTTALRLPAAHVDRWLDTLQARLTAHCVADLVALRDLFRIVETDVERLVTNAGGPPILARLQFLDDERLRRMLNAHLLVQRPYNGEVPRPGVLEYAMVARRYQMIAFMFISAFGLSFLRTYREFMVPSAVLLLALGGLNVYVSVRRERVETLDKELERAREAMRSETRRVLTEIQRGWMALLTQHLSDQVASVVSQVESAVRAHHGREATSVAQERQRIQRQLQAIETTERKLVTASKTRDTAAATLAQFRTELRPLVVSPVKPPAVRV